MTILRKNGGDDGPAPFLSSNPIVLKIRSYDLESYKG